VADEAAWQAACEYDTDRGTPPAAFVRSRVLAAALAHYRREWAYAIHSSRPASETAACVGSSQTDCCPLNDAVRCAVARLPDEQRRLIEQICVLQRTEEDVARDLGISRQAVSLRKCHALALLRSALMDTPRP